MARSQAANDLARLTGVRSGKRSYYREFVRSDERMQRTVRALDSISRALVRTSQGPREIMEEIARAAGEQLVAAWSILGLRDGRLPWAQPRYVVVDEAGRPCGEDSLPEYVGSELAALRAGAEHRTMEGNWVRIALRIEGEQIGSLVVFHRLEGNPEPDDLSLLRILANQAAVALRTAELYQSGVDIQRRAGILYDEVATYASDLASSATQLQLTRKQLVAADQRALIDSERHRIARELHDSVSQIVLSAGLAVDLARLDSAELDCDAGHITSRLDQAKGLTQDALQRLRTAIYALHHTERGEDPATLAEVLEEVAAGYRAQLDIAVRVQGTYTDAANEYEHELARIAGEALFNVATHAEATKVEVRVSSTENGLVLSVADDGVGDPRALRQILRIEQSSNGTVGHRGLANMAHRAEQIGASFSLRRSNLGGLQVRVAVPRTSDEREST